MKKYVFNYDMNACDLANHIAENVVYYLNCGDYEDLHEAIYETIDNKLIYCKDQWEVIETYCTPQNCNLYDAIEMLINDVYGLIEEDEEDEE